MSDPYVYTPDEVTATFGVPITIPGILDASFQIEDFETISIVHDLKFSLKMGVFNNPSINARRVNSATVNFSVLYGSEDNENFNRIIRAQEFGIAGLPLYIRHITRDDEQRQRPTHICAVALLTNRPKFDYKKLSEPKDYSFKIPYIQTIFL